MNSSNETYPKTLRNDKKRRNFSITISLVLIFIARNIKTNDFHFILNVSQETAMNECAKGVRGGPEQHLVAWKM